MAGVDSAVGPSLEQAQAIKAAGYSWHGWYCGGPGAFHNWTRQEIAVLNGEYELSMPIYVPSYPFPGGQALNTTARDDAERGAFIVGLAGWKIIMAWDTEDYMRGDSLLIPYLVEGCSTIKAGGGINVVYGGGFRTIADWPTALMGLAFPWWVIPGGKQAPPGTAWQTGQDTIAGLHVDTDSIGDGFPLATRV